MSLSDLKGAVEEVLPSLKQQCIQVFILSENCDVEGIESLSDKIQQAGDQPLSRHLRANINFKSPALYIYTSGTTGNLTGLSDLHLLSVFAFLACRPRVTEGEEIKISYLLGLPKAAVINHERLWMASFLQTIAGVRSDDIIYVYLPLYHSSAFLMGLCGAIERGNT